MAVTIIAAGDGPLSYQWYADGTIPIPESLGGASPTVGVASATLAISGHYLTCVVSNAVGVVLSEPALITVVP